MRSARIPEGWQYWCAGDPDYEQAWRDACALKAERERLRPDLLVRVKPIAAPGGHWIIRREEKRAT